jgi:uncharacterized protein YbbK (DUF523 family)
LADRPLIAVCGCLLGMAVRYDGGDRRSSAVSDILVEEFRVLPICPEVDAGLEVPRPPVQLVGSRESLRAVGRDDAELDVTAALEGFARSKMAELQGISGFIGKSRSPSCGLDTTPLFDLHGNRYADGSGIFVQLLQQHYPRLPLEDELGIADPARRADFIQRVLAY